MYSLKCLRVSTSVNTCTYISCYAQTIIITFVASKTERMKIKNIIILGCVALGIWGYRNYKNGGDPIGTIEELVQGEVSGFKSGFKEGLSAVNKAQSNASSASSTVDYPASVIDRLELPKLSREKGQYFVTHMVGESVNYSLEYDADKHHCRWVAFTFDEDNSRDVVGRMDTWMWDPKLPQSLSTEADFKGSGYSRGHMVASEDRVSSKEANKQTFYYSNVSPQLQSHNAGIWKHLEEKVRAWGRNNNMRKVLYVAKGGTIAEGQIEPKRLRGKIVIPKYYWMALLAEDMEGRYHAIAFLTEHRKYEKGEGNLQKLALSVDELESFTGLDFFHNLDDRTEQQVEAVAPLGPESRRYWWVR